MTSIAVSGGKIFGGKSDGFIRVWDLITFVEMPPLQAHTNSVHCLFASGDRLYSSSQDTTIRVWDLPTHKEVGCLRGHTNEVNCLAVSRSMHELYSGGNDKTIRKWDLVTFSELLSVECTGIVTHLAISSRDLYHTCSDNYLERSGFEHSSALC